MCTIYGSKFKPLYKKKEIYENKVKGYKYTKKVLLQIISTTNTHKYEYQSVDDSIQ